MGSDVFTTENANFAHIEPAFQNWLLCDQDQVYSAKPVQQERTMHRPVTTKDLVGLNHAEVNFVCEYLKDFDHRRAAEASGKHPDQGVKILNTEHVQAAIDVVLNQRLASPDITPEWLLMELVDNHMLARQTGKLSASNAALNTVARMNLVDAFAADKVITISDQSVVDRLMRGRQRAAQRSDDAPAPEQPTTPSFL